MKAETKRFTKGMIILWSGAIADIPGGFALCDGNNGTPDLRNRFIVGAGDMYAVDGTGGSANHTHIFETAGHTHEIALGTGIEAGTSFNTATETEMDDGTTNLSDSRPPYYALAYIMKL